MKQLKQYFLSTIGLLLMSSTAYSQSKLDGYISEGLANNSVLQHKQIDVEKAMIALKIAKSNYLPTVNFSGTFSTAKGGRYTDLPVGDLLNPVYATLNQLTSSSSFPQIENQQINFLPQNYYDAYVRTAVPLVNTDIIYNKRIEEQKTVLSQLDLDLYARQLVNDIKVAYFNYQSSVQAVEIYKKALATLEKNIALNEALIANGKGLNIHLVRAKSEWEATNAQLIQAENQQRNAQTYFNFLLNKDLSSPIENELVVSDAATTSNDISNREEINLLEQSRNIQQTVLRMNELYWVPRLNAFLDLGFQGVDWEVSSKSAYYMVGVSLSIPIFNGTRNRQQIKLSEWNLKQADLAIQQTTQQLSLAVQVALNALSTATANYESSLKQLEAAQEYFRLIEDAQKQGVATEIEFIDAANQLTQSELQVSLLQQQINSAVANLERETATYPIESLQKTK